MLGMSSEDLDWLVKSFPVYLGQVLRGETKQAFIRAEMLMKGTSTAPGCSCQGEAYKQKIIGYYKEWASIQKQNM